MSFTPLVEIGVDYDGVDKRHHQTNEIHSFKNDKPSRIFVPDCGSFYVDDLVVRDVNSGKELVRGVDYTTLISDNKACLESGKEVHGVVCIDNVDITEVSLDYQFVGGKHSSGYYVLENLLKMYPNGISVLASFDSLIDIPEEWVPGYHTHHLNEFNYKEDLLVALERLRQSIIQKYSTNLERLYDNAQASLDKINNVILDLDKQLKDDLQSSLQKLQVQDGEYIFTDNPNNPKTYKGYGEWVQVKNVILRGLNTDFVVGSGSVLAMGSEQIIRNTYLWLRQDGDSNKIDYTITTDKETLNEGDTITFTLQTKNLADGMVLPWVLGGVNNTDFNNYSGNFVVRDNKATTTLKAVKDGRSEGIKQYRLGLRDYPRVFKDFTLNDNAEIHITGIAFVDQNNSPLTGTNEGTSFRLLVKTKSMIGKKVYFNWKDTTVNKTIISPSLPTELLITSDDQYIDFQLMNNYTVDGDSLLKVYATETPDEEIVKWTAYSQLVVIDSSIPITGELTFTNSKGIPTTPTEGEEFNICLKTNNGVGEEITFEYMFDRENRVLMNFKPKATIDNNLNISFPVVLIDDFKVNIPIVLIVNAKHKGRIIATKSLTIDESNKTINGELGIYSDPQATTAISSVNEGDTFYVAITDLRYKEGLTAPEIDLVVTMDGVDVGKRFELPPLTNIKFGAQNTNRVSWVRGNTLVFRFKAIENKAIDGNTYANFSWKQSNKSDYSKVQTLSVFDTSKPTITGVWSTDPNRVITPTEVLTPMEDGYYQPLYLFLSSDGDLKNLTGLKISGIPSFSVSTPSDEMFFWDNENKKDTHSYNISPVEINTGIMLFPSPHLTTDDLVTLNMSLWNPNIGDFVLPSLNMKRRELKKTNIHKVSKNIIDSDVIVTFKDDLTYEYPLDLIMRSITVTSEGEKNYTYVDDSFNTYIRSLELYVNDVKVNTTTSNIITVPKKSSNVKLVVKCSSNEVANYLRATINDRVGDTRLGSFALIR